MGKAGRAAPAPNVQRCSRPAIWRRVLLRHSAVAALAALLVGGFWASRMEWSADMRLWRAIGDASLILLLITLLLGPAARLWRGPGLMLPWRRELGIWCALAALLHTLLVVSGWTQWSVTRLLGYEFIPQLGRDARLEPGFGLANLIGLVAVLWLLLLAATSSDRALRMLGAPAWKWLHNSAYVVLYLSLLHTVYFLSCTTPSPCIGRCRRPTGSGCPSWRSPAWS